MEDGEEEGIKIEEEEREEEECKLVCADHEKRRTQPVAQ